MTLDVFMPAARLARLLRTREVSATEVTRAFIAQVERVNPKVNAIVTFVPELALRRARALDRRKPGPGQALWGMPIAYKDLVPTRGIRTTQGSLVYEHHVPDEDHAIVERLAAAGAVTLGKTNTPEFGAGSQTFNKLFGTTRNPYDLAKTSGGSSGGAAAAVACGMLPFADGSDLAASLRNPGNYCNVVGFRPTPGRVPQWPGADAWNTLSVTGPLGRTVEDCALLFSAMAGPDARDPTTMAEPGAIFLRKLSRDFRRVRVAWSRDLGGLPVEPQVGAVLEPHRRTLKALGCVVEDAEPDFAGATEAFETLRAVGFVQKLGPLLAEHRARLKDTVIWNVEEGLRRSAADVARAQGLRSALYHRMRRFLERYEFLVLPVSQVPPFDVEQPYVSAINGVALETYIDWMRSCYYVSATGLPAISVPCGFTPEGLPVGIQIVGRHQDEWGLLQLAHAFEQATGFWKRRPAVVMRAG